MGFVMPLPSESPLGQLAVVLLGNGLAVRVGVALPQLDRDGIWTVRCVTVVVPYLGNGEIGRGRRRSWPSSGSGVSAPVLSDTAAWP